MTHHPLIAILTDFGTQDPFVGIMKGVIGQIAPQANIIDLTHAVPPGDVRRAGIQLWQARPHFPPKTVFLGVVDPGVGTFRKGIAASHGDYSFVGPDNGLFSFVLGSDAAIYELSESSFQLSHPSSTFHGRDIFAPAAAYLATGTAINEFGNSVPDPIQQPDPILTLLPPSTGNPMSNTGRPGKELSIEGEILFSDRFGNLVTSIGLVRREGQKAILSPWIQTAMMESVEFSTAYSHLVTPGGRSVRWFNTFADIPPGDIGILVGSSGLVEIAANGSSAAAITGFTEKETMVLKVEYPL